MTIRHLYPAVEPSLNLDFANSKRLDSRITFTRGSIGTYTDESGIIRTAADNEARFDHDSDGNSLGLLIEESRTNEITISMPTNSNTGITNTSVSGLPGVFETARKFTSSGGNDKRITLGTNTSGVTFTYSFYARLGTQGTSVFIRNGTGPYVNFNLSTQTITNSNWIANSEKMEYVGNGWYRCSASAIGTGSSGFLVGVADGNGLISNAGDNMIVGGFQLEQGSFPTSYIPTAGSTIQRAADVASITGTNFSSWYNSSEGTFVAKYKSQFPDGEDTTVFQGDTTNTLRLFQFVNLNRVQFYYNGSFSYSNNATSGYPPESEYSSAALFYTDDGANASVGGSYQGFPVVSTTSTGGATITQLKFAPFTGAAGALQASSAHLTRLAYYPVRLPDATLQALTL